jgi:hypothetical protein
MRANANKFNLLNPTKYIPPKCEFVWFINSHYRAAFDFGLGGTLVDFRTYAGRVDGDVGPDSACQWNETQR